MIGADELEPFGSAGAQRGDGRVVRAPGALRRAAAGRRAGRGRVVAPAGPAPAQEIRQGQGTTYRDRPDSKLSPRSSRSTRTPSPAPTRTATRRSTRTSCGGSSPGRRSTLTLDVSALARGLRPDDASGWSRRAHCRRERRSGSLPTATSSSPSARSGSTSRSTTETPRPRRPAASSTQRFKAADANKDGYLEGKELAAINAPQSPLAGLLGGHRPRRRRQDLPEGAARLRRPPASEPRAARLVVTTADQGRAIFGILDLDRDRRLGAAR